MTLKRTDDSNLPRPFIHDYNYSVCIMISSVLNDRLSINFQGTRKGVPIKGKKFLSNQILSYVKVAFSISVSRLMEHSFKLLYSNSLSRFTKLNCNHPNDAYK